MKKIMSVNPEIIVPFDKDLRTILLQAANTNQGTIYVGFTRETTIATDCVWELRAGDWLILDDYFGELYAASSADGEILNGGYYTRFKPTGITLK